MYRSAIPDRLGLPETIGEADLANLNLALAALFDRLREARVQFDAEGDYGRLAACNAVGAFWQFITQFRAPYMQSLQVPILRLQDALSKLNENRVEPILQPAPSSRGGRPPSSDAYASLKGQAVATVELLHGMGLERRAARLAVAKELSKLGVRPGHGSGRVSATTLRNWRDEILSDVGRHTVAAKAYDDTLAPAERKRFSNMPNEQAKNHVLGVLTHWVKSVFPELQKPS
jgi:hypothetical protein